MEFRGALRSLAFAGLAVAGCSQSARSDAGDVADVAQGVDAMDAADAADVFDAPSFDSFAPDAADDAADAPADTPGDIGPPETVTSLFDRVRIASHGDEPNFQRAETPITFSGGPFARAMLVVDLGTTCYPFDGWRTDPPPTGENWPADCDAFDRNFEFSLDDPAQAGGAPGLELERAITPFGGPLHLEVDVTDVVNGLPGAHTLRVTIPTYSDAQGQVSGSDGGWFVSASLHTVAGPAPHHVLAVVPLFDLDETSSTPRDTTFMAPPGTTSARLEYRATGHGGGPVGPGCNGPAEEFCRRTHTLTIDGAALDAFAPIRSDCGDLCTLSHYGPADGGFDYCLENPCGAVGSVTASRANWCPGSETPPRVYTDGALATAGPHTLRYQISTVATGGTWRLSATYFAFGP